MSNSSSTANAHTIPALPLTSTMGQPVLRVQLCRGEICSNILGLDEGKLLENLSVLLFHRCDLREESAHPTCSMGRQEYECVARV
jgi:hypothetical protein